MTWTNKYKKSIDCNNPKGFSQKAHCQARKLRQAGKDTKSKPVEEAVKMSSLDRFRKAAADREKKHQELEKEMKARHAAGKEDMKGSIDRLEKSLNKEEVEHKVGDSVTVNSKFFGKQKGKVTKVDKQSVHVQRDGKKTSEKYPHDAVMKEDIEQIDEKEMSPAQQKKKEEIVLSMKDKTKEFKAKYGKLAEQKMKETVAKLRNEGLWDASGSSGFTGATPNAGNASDDGTRPDVNAEFEKMAIMKPKRKLNNKNNPEINQKGTKNV